MGKLYRVFFTSAFLLFFISVSAQRSGRTKDPMLKKGEGLEVTRSDLNKMRTQNQDKKARVADVYMFAASFSMLDSVFYVSDIQLVNDVTINNKWFIKERLAYEKQFTDYVAKDDDESIMTSVVFSEKRKKLVKQRTRLIKRNKKKNGFAPYMISDFKFSIPLPESE